MREDEEFRRKEASAFLSVMKAFGNRSRTLDPRDVGDGWKLIKLPDEPQFKFAMSWQKDVRDGWLSCMLERRRPGRDNIKVFPSGRWHLSLAHNSPIRAGINIAGRIPTWEELREARYKFVPDETNMVIMFPPKRMYYNRHQTCIHLLEVPTSLALDPRQAGGL